MALADKFLNLRRNSNILCFPPPNYHSILDTRISVRPSVQTSSVTLRVPPLDSEMGWTGKLWLKTDLLNWQK